MAYFDKIKPMPFYQAKVKSLDDPNEQGRISVDVVGIADDVWALPLFPCAGSDVAFFMHPAIGDNCVVCFTGDADGVAQIQNCFILGYWYPSSLKDAAFSEGTPPTKMGLGYVADNFILIEQGASGKISLYQDNSCGYFIARADKVIDFLNSQQGIYNTHTHTYPGAAPGVTATPNNAFPAGDTDIKSKNKTQ